jgi:hypothetical protein
MAYHGMRRTSARENPRVRQFAFWQVRNAIRVVTPPLRADRAIRQPRPLPQMSKNSRGEFWTSEPMQTENPFCLDKCPDGH